VSKEACAQKIYLVNNFVLYTGNMHICDIYVNIYRDAHTPMNTYDTNIAVVKTVVKTVVKSSTYIETHTHL